VKHRDQVQLFHHHRHIVPSNAAHRSTPTVYSGQPFNPGDVVFDPPAESSPD